MTTCTTASLRRGCRSNSFECCRCAKLSRKRLRLNWDFLRVTSALLTKLTFLCWSILLSKFFPPPEEHALKMRVSEVLQRIITGTVSQLG